MESTTVFVVMKRESVLSPYADAIIGVYRHASDAAAVCQEWNSTHHLHSDAKYEVVCSPFMEEIPC